MDHPTELLADARPVLGGGPLGEGAPHIEVEHTNAADPAWHFAIAVRPDSQLVEQPEAMVPTAGARTQSLAVFRTTAPLADVEVVGHLLAYEIDAADWLARALEADGREIVSSKPVAVLSGVVGDTVARWHHEGEDFVGRYVATQWGARLFIVCCRTAAAHYPALADSFFHSIASFEPLDQSHGAFAEDVHLIELDEPHPCRIRVPASWTVQPHAATAELGWFEARHQAPGPADEQTGKADGQLAFAVMARSVAQRPRQAANVLLRALHQAGGVALDHADFEQQRRDKPFTHAWQLTTGVKQGEALGELRCRVLMNKAIWVVATVLGPTSDGDDDAWMRNKRALDLALSTLEIAPRQAQKKREARDH